MGWLPIATLAIFATTALLGLIFLFIAYRIVRGFGRIVFRQVRAGSDRVVVQTVAFAIAVFLFPEVAAYALRVATGVIECLFVGLPAAAIPAGMALGECDANSDGSCLQQLGGALTSAWMRLANQLISAFDIGGMPIVSIILCLATWVVLSFVLDRAAAAASGAPEAQAGFIGRGLVAIRATPSRIWAGLSFVFLLLFATYLGIVAVAAIPTLSKGVTQKIDITLLQDKLLKIKISDEQFDRRFPPTILESPPAALDGDRIGLSQASLSRQNALRAETIANMIGMWQRLVDFQRKQQSDLLEYALVEYELGNLNRLESRLQSQHYIALINWYQNSIHSIEEDLNTCRTEINRYNRTTNTQLAALTEALQATERPSLDYVMPILAGIGGSTDNVAVLCQIRASDHPAPKRGDLGSDLGPLGWSMQWLLKAESLPLALIVGLLGFGLLGATISSLVRQSVARPLSEPAYAADIPGVVTRGVGAAIVVFLAAYGGLAIFGSTDAQPNAYVVLFICLVGAVFSDEVWGWARNRLRQSLGVEDGSAGAGGAADASDAARPETPAPGKAPDDGGNPVGAAG